MTETSFDTTTQRRTHFLLDRGALQSISSNDLVSRDEGKDGSVSADPASLGTDEVESSTANSTKGGSSTQEYAGELNRNILREEEKNVRRARILVGVAFLACAAAITCTVYFLTKQSDQSAFEAEVSFLVGYSHDQATQTY